MVKKILFLIIFLVILGCTPFIYTKVVGISSSQNAFLSIKELKGQDNVYIDGISKGTTPMLNIQISPGTHLIKIERNNYYTLTKEISFTGNTNTLINTQLGPNETYTLYTILSSRQSNGNTGILVTTDDPSQDGMHITLNNGSAQLNTILPQNPGTYQLAVQNNGFIGINNQIVLTKNYILTDIVHLSRKPL